MVSKETDEKEVKHVKIEVQTDTVETPKAKKPFGQKLKQFLATKKGKVAAALCGLVIIVAILLAIPVTRYSILGLVISKDVQVIVTDSGTKKPVSQANVTLGANSGVTDQNGKLTLNRVPVGRYDLTVSKKYYANQQTTYTVPVLTQPTETAVALTATGRQVVVHIHNSITNAPVNGVKITAGEVIAQSNDKGEVALVLSTKTDTVEAKLEANNYLTTTANLTISDQVDANKLSITPTGKIYFLSKQTGQVSIVSANLDGTSSETVVQGTGNENDRATALLAARDWKYLALLANRDGSKSAQLYLYDTEAKQLKLIDQGDVNFSLVGWSGHKFIYTVERNNPDWVDRRQGLKSYDAENSQLATLDETTGSGTSYYDYQKQAIDDPYIIENKIVYAKRWDMGQQYGYTGTDKKLTINDINADGSGKRVVKEFAIDQAGVIQGKLYEPQGIYYRVSPRDDVSVASFYEYEDGAVKAATTTDEKFYGSNYPTYLISPNGQKTFWSESRDGKNVLFIGNNKGEKSLTLAEQSDYKAYGWITDNYVLLSKNGSELFIAAADQPMPVAPMKISNYHKPDISFPGYGSGYGGI